MWQAVGGPANTGMRSDLVIDMNWMSKWRTWFSVFLVLITVVSGVTSLVVFARTEPSSPDIKLRVAYYDYYPLLFKNKAGQAAGILPEVFSRIAQKESWSVEYLFLSWEECLNRLESGKIDVLLGIGRSPGRLEKYKYNQQPFISDWAQVYAPRDMNIESFKDLAGKKIGGLSRDIFFEEGSQSIKELMSRFDFQAGYRGYSSYRLLFKALLKGEVDAGVFGRLTGRYLKNNMDTKDHIAPSTISFSPYRMYAAFPPEAKLTPYLVERIDFQLERMKRNPESFFYQVKEKYMADLYEPITLVPPWLIWALIVGGGAVIFLAVGTFILRKRVKSQTGRLKERNRALNILIDSNQAMMRAPDEKKLFAEVCRIIVETGGYDLAWIGRENEGLEVCAHCGGEDGYLDEITDSDSKIINENDPSLLVLETGERKIIENLDNQQTVNFSREKVREYGYRCLAIFPLKIKDQAVGVVALYSKKMSVFSASEIELLKEFAVDISFGLKALRNQENLRDSLEEEKTLLQEVHHRVKNNLFTMISFLEMQLVSASGEETCQVLEEAITRLNAMALVHKNIYSNKELSRIDFTSYLKELTTEVITTLKDPELDININFDLDEANFSLDLMIPCGLVINELLTNAVRHGFKGRKEGEIELVFKTGEEYHELKIRDNGVGLPEGFSLKEGTSLGLKLVTTMVEKQLEGELSYNSNGYTEFIIKFKAPSIARI